MSKSRLCISSDVLFSEAMDALPVEARLLYVYLNAETNIIGEISRPVMVVRGLGFDHADFQALIDAGFVLVADDDIGRRYFIRHHFKNNALANQGQRSSAEKYLSEAEHLICFTGERWKSTYCLVERPSSTDSLNVATSSLDIEPEVILNESKYEINGKQSKPDSEFKANYASPPKMAPCPYCSNRCLVGPEGRRLHGTCDEHGDFFIDPSTGEYVEGL